MTEQRIIKEHIEELQRRIETVKRFMRTHEGADTSSCKDNIQRWEAIIAELKKRIPEKAVRAEGKKWYFCPICEAPVTSLRSTLDGFEKVKYPHCEYCGQSIDWSDTP